MTKEPAATPVLMRICSHVRETHNVVSLELECETRHEACSPGQFFMLYVMGVGEIPVSVSAIKAKGRLTHSIRAVGAVSQALTRLEEGDMVGLRGPFGTSWPLGELAGRDIVVLAGGIGLAPLRPVLHHLHERYKDYGRITLLYGARGPADILFSRELQAWRKAGRIRVEAIVDHAGKGWQGPVGVVTSLITAELFDPMRATALICGPEVMMRVCAAALEAQNLPDRDIFIAMERNMHCALGHCGHCQFGPVFICKDGPVLRYDKIKSIFCIREI